MTRSHSLLALALATSLVACGPPPAPAPAGEAQPPTDEELVARVAGYREGGFVQVSTPFASQHAADLVEVWVSAAHVDAYRGLSPDDGSMLTLAEGAAIVKRHLRADGGEDGFTAMVKDAARAEEGEGGVWWWARVDAAGDPLVAGHVQFCVDCHTPRAGADYLFGVHPAARIAP